MVEYSLDVTPGGPTVKGSVLRTDQAYLELLAAKNTFDGGIAFWSPAFPRLQSTNQFREVWVKTAAEAAAAIQAAENFYHERGTRCATVALAESQPVETIEGTLSAAGYRRADNIVMGLGAWPPDAVTAEADPASAGRHQPDGPRSTPGKHESSAPPAHADASASDIRVLPARPMREAFRECWSAAASFYPPSERDMVVDAANERLDDQRVDAFVAMVAGKPAGMCTLLQIGDVGRIVDVYVLPAHRRAGVATALVRYVIAITKRLAARVVCVEIPLDDAAGKGLFTALGFIDVGRTVEFHHRKTARPDYATW